MERLKAKFVKTNFFCILFGSESTYLKATFTYQNGLIVCGVFFETIKFCSKSVTRQKSDVATDLKNMVRHFLGLYQRKSSRVNAINLLSP